MTKATTQARAFTLTIEPTLTDDYGIRLEVATGNPEHPRQTIAHVLPANVSGVADPLLQALRESGQPRTILSASRRKPIPLVEPAGVRLALALLAADPVNKHGRRNAILSGIAAMSTEEAYYWYAKTTGPYANRARRALRILLADDGRTGLTS
jgi:hypothetical protein